MRLLRKGSLILSLILVHGTAYALLGAPKPDLWPLWDASDESNTATIDHSEWQSLLDKYLIDNDPGGINRFDYVAVTDADRERLDAYVERLASLDPRHYNRRVQEAYWINLYNAITVDLIVQHYPVTSIRRIYGGLFRTGPWNRKIVEIAGEELTLNDIEHRILRPIYQDPRVHYAVNCASIGCPNLAASVYTGATLDRLLDQGARAYINHPRGVRFDSRRLQLSKIYDWFAVDFGDNEAGILQHLSQYAEPKLAERLRAYQGDIDYGYDWSLNAP